MKRFYLLASVGVIALLSACEQWGKLTNSERSQPKKTESAAFFDAVVANSADGYRSFLESYPSGRYTSIAVNLMTTCSAGTCASDKQLQEALLSAVAIARGQPAASTAAAAALQQPAASTTRSLDTRTQPISGSSY